MKSGISTNVAKSMLAAQPLMCCLKCVHMCIVRIDHKTLRYVCKHVGVTPSISKSLGMLCLAAQNEQSTLQRRPHQVSLPWHHLGVQHLSYFSQADNICQRQASSHVASCCLTSMGASVVQVCFVHLRAVRASCGLGSTFNCCHIARLLETDLGSG